MDLQIALMNFVSFIFFLKLDNIIASVEKVKQSDFVDFQFCFGFTFSELLSSSADIWFQNFADLELKMSRLAECNTTE